jgi:hypothetical protein
MKIYFENRLKEEFPDHVFKLELSEHKNWFDVFIDDKKTEIKIINLNRIESNYLKENFNVDIVKPILEPLLLEVKKYIDHIKTFKNNEKI